MHEINQVLSYDAAGRADWAKHPYGNQAPATGCFGGRSDYDYFIGSREARPAAHRGSQEPTERTALIQSVNRTFTGPAAAPVAAARFHHNPYARYAYANITINGITSWDNGDFILNLDTFIADKLPLLNGELPSAFSFALVGCHGVDTASGMIPHRNNGNTMKRIGRLMSQPGKNLFNFVLGDNVYQNGVTHPRDPQFVDCFYKWFRNVECFAILGNHDYNMHSGAHRLQSKTKLYRAMCQVYHSYLKPTQLDPSRDDAYPEMWNMPFRYYVLVSEKLNTVFICIDSNTLPFDRAQQLWLYNIYQTLNIPNTQGLVPNFVLISHHPLEYYSVRAEKQGEWRKYLQPGRLDYSHQPAINNFTTRTQGDLILPTWDVSARGPATAGPHINSMGHYIKLFLETNNLRFNVIFAAHEHLMAYEEIDMNYSDNTHKTPPEKIAQFVSGAGGADLNRPLRGLPRRHIEGGAFATPTHGYLQAKLSKELLTVDFCYSDGKGSFNTTEVPLASTRARAATLPTHRHLAAAAAAAPAYLDTQPNQPVSQYSVLPGGPRQPAGGGAPADYDVLTTRPSTQPAYAVSGLTGRPLPAEPGYDVAHHASAAPDYSVADLGNNRASIIYAVPPDADDDD